MTFRARVALVGAFLIAATAATAATAAERTHVVRPGESPSGIASSYYGDYDLAAVLLLYNDDHGPTIHPGETLRVPFCDIHRVRAGDTGSALTSRFLGDGSRWSVVAELNGLVPEQTLRIGQEIVFPVVLDYTLHSGDTLAGLAARFWDDPGRGTLLQAFNGLDDPRRLAPGQVVHVPLLGLRHASSSPSPDAPRGAAAATPAPAEPPGSSTEESSNAVAEPAEPATERIRDAVPDQIAPTAGSGASTPRFSRELGAAAVAYRHGEYERARALLEALRGPVEQRGNRTDRRDFWRQLGFLEVAFDRPDAACEAFARLKRIDGEIAFDPARVSPKISDALRDCR